jgi:hypothetical protein
LRGPYMKREKGTNFRESCFPHTSVNKGKKRKGRK